MPEGNSCMPFSFDERCKSSKTSLPLICSALPGPPREAFEPADPRVCQLSGIANALVHHALPWDPTAQMLVLLAVTEWNHDMALARGVLLEQREHLLTGLPAYPKSSPAELTDGLLGRR
jgi:hypothetical protein